MEKRITQYQLYEFKDKARGVTIQVPAATLDHAKKQVSHQYNWTGGLKPGTYKNAQMACVIAGALPGEWDLEPKEPEHVDSSGWRFTRKLDGLELVLHRHAHDAERFEIRYCTPRKGNQTYWVHKTNRGMRSVWVPTITVTSKKHGSAIARDIIRRLLPEATEVHKLALEQMRQANEAQLKREESIVKLCDKIGDPPVVNTNGELCGRVYLPMHKVADVRSDGSVDINLYGLKLEQALELVSLMQDWEAHS